MIGWLQNAKDTPVRRMNIKLDPSNGAAHALKQRGCTDMARLVVSSRRNEMTLRWSTKKWKKTYINIERRAWQNKVVYLF